MNNTNLPIYYPDSATIGEQGQLQISGLELNQLAQEYSSPLYIIDELTLRNNIQALNTALKTHYSNSLAIYASKALCLTSILSIIKEEGMGVDVVSSGELYTAQSINFPAEKVFLHGNNKSYEEILMTASYGGNIILDNFSEINILKQVASELADKTIQVLLRVTPGVECHTHEYIRTGQNDSKFGFDFDQLDQAIQEVQNISNVKLLGLHSHIGSQIFEIEPFVDATKILLDKYKYIKQEYNLDLEYLNLGGGFGMCYTEQDDPPSIDSLIKQMTDAIKSKCAEYNLQLPFLIVEPGRSLAARAGITLYSIGSQKQITLEDKSEKHFISVDGGMADNPRPITYQAEYRASLVKDPLNKLPQKQYTLAGRYCESGDILIKNLSLSTDINTDDLIVVFGTGAYNYSMASNYNRVAKPAMVLVNNQSSDLILKRETFDDMLRNDVLPNRLAN